jgi:hypothetical protein
MQTHDGGPLPLPPGASDLRGHEPARGRIRGLADGMGQREQGQDQLIFSRKLSNPRTNKRTYTTLNHLLLARNHYVTSSISIYKFEYS